LGAGDFDDAYHKSTENSKTHRGPPSQVGLSFAI
jgi:hypothetical protein